MPTSPETPRTTAIGTDRTSSTPKVKAIAEAIGVPPSERRVEVAMPRLEEERDHRECRKSGAERDGRIGPGDRDIQAGKVLKRNPLRDGNAVPDKSEQQGKAHSRDHGLEQPLPDTARCLVEE